LSIAHRLSWASGASIDHNRRSRTRWRIFRDVRVRNRSPPCPNTSNDSFADFREADGRFARGNGGGPGRPRARDRIAALDQRVADAGEELIEAALTAAKGGNIKAIEMLLNRIWPASRGRPVEIAAPKIRVLHDVIPATAAITDAVLAGDVTPAEGEAAARVIKVHGDLIGLIELEERLTALEEKTDDRERAARTAGKR
jgi:hypothetical protein